MTELMPEKLDEARINEAVRRGTITTPVKSALAHLCDVFNEGWTPPPKVDPDLLAAREWGKAHTSYANFQIDAGDCDEIIYARAFLAGIRHGRANP